MHPRPRLNPKHQPDTLKPWTPRRLRLKASTYQGSTYSSNPVLQPEAKEQACTRKQGTTQMPLRQLPALLCVARQTLLGNVSSPSVLRAGSKWCPVVARPRRALQESSRYAELLHFIATAELACWHLQDQVSEENWPYMGAVALIASLDLKTPSTQEASAVDACVRKLTICGCGLKTSGWDCMR